ncbi:MAG: YceI family protein [Candidatus Dormibacteria bacterium]
MSQKYQIDPAHSNLGFRISHLGVGQVQGRFAEFSGQAEIDGESPAGVEVTIKTASVGTGSEQRDTHLRAGDFFDAERFPEARFTASSFRPDGTDTYVVSGELTLRDVTRPVELRAHFDGRVTDPWGNDRIGITATGKIRPEEFGLTWNQEVGPVKVVGPEVTLDIAAALVAPVAVPAEGVA